MEMLSTWKVEGEYGQECCKIRLSDLKLSSQGRALSHSRTWAVGSSGTNGPYRGRGAGGSAPTPEKPTPWWCLLLQPLSGFAAREAYEKPPCDCKNPYKYNNQKSLRNARLVAAPSYIRMQSHLLREDARLGSKVTIVQPRP